MVGSSRIYSVCSVSRFDSLRVSFTRWVLSFERVVADCFSRMYVRLTFINVCSLRVSVGTVLKNLRVFSMVIFSISWMVLFLYLIFSVLRL